MAQLFIGRVSLVIDVFGMKLMLGLLTPSKTSYKNGERWKSSSQIMLKLRPQNEYSTYYEPYASKDGKAKLNTNIKTLLNTAGNTSNDATNGT